MADPGVSVQQRFEAPRALVWALLADTNRYDRALGLGVPRYEWREIDGQRRQVGHGSQGGVSMSWIEQPYEWIEGQQLSSRRDYLSGPAEEGGLRVELTDDGDGCLATVTASGVTRSRVLRALGPLIRAHLRRKLRAYVEAIAAMVKAPHSSAVDDLSQPAATRAQALVSEAYDETLSGRSTPCDHAELERRAQRLSSAPIDPTVREAIVQALGSRPDEEVSQMRPFELARQWGHDRRRVLQGFLHGTRAGLVDLNWQVNCPVCKVAAGVVSNLGDVGRDVHCEACNIRYDIDFGANVEAVFRCNRAIRDVEPAVYCAASPSFRPHVLAQLRIATGEHRTETLHPGDGRLRLRTLADQQPAELRDEAVPARVEVTVTPTAVTAQAHGVSKDGAMTLELRSTLDAPGYLLIERGAWA
ncbi:MAG: SRPBCC family protein, partial [Deltaproteobacteria bacterium]|nr:SRPBCC family protein [Deltaproteobacteria bacterium]